MSHRFTSSLLTVAAAATLWGCGSGSHGSHSADSSTKAGSSMPANSAMPAGAAAAFNTAEVKFSQGMIAHHEQAIEMAEIALDPTRGASPAVVDLATRIKGAQDAEVTMMTGWLATAGAPMQMDASDGHDMMSMDGMMSADEMDAMSALTGTEFDTSWLTMMIAHHEGAISQSKDVKSAGTNPDVVALADAIIEAQQAEIAEMKALLAA